MNEVVLPTFDRAGPVQQAAMNLDALTGPFLASGQTIDVAEDAGRTATMRRRQPYLPVADDNRADIIGPASAVERLHSALKSHVPGLM